MADFHQFVSWNSLILSEHTLGGRQEGCRGRWLKRLKQRSKMARIIEFIMALISTFTHNGLTFHYIPWSDVYWRGSHTRFPLPNYSTLLAPFHQSCIYMVSKNHSGTANEWTLAKRGLNYAQLFSVSIIISWGYKMNFSLYVNMSVLLKQSHNIMHTCNLSM